MTKHTGSSTTETLVIPTVVSSTYANVTVVRSASIPSSAPKSTQVVDAVYGYIQAVRALGKEKITTADIASALSLPHYTVVDAVQRLHDRGVHPIK